MIRRLRLARCSLFGHCWARWSPWELEGFGFRHERSCIRCTALEVQRDGEEPVLYA